MPTSPPYAITALRAVLCGLFWLFFAAQAMATHNRAGEITYRSAPLPGQPYRYIFNIHTYTKVSGGGAEAADRDTLTILFGDGNQENAPRVNGGSNTTGEEIGQ
ncbi:MAG: hypothetical protein IPL33_09145 [Sphingobacteriales bacterium]|nr:hypothetical protein [Sphingobacteriales bacterium]